MARYPAVHGPAPAPAGAEEPLVLEATDGLHLAATRFRPAADPSARVLIGSATGVPRGYYAGFARALAARGFEAVTFDYRGIGDSAPPRLRGFEASMADWGRLDLAGALRWVRGQTSALSALSALPPLPALFVGHSVAGQVLPLAEGADALAAVLLVGSMSGNARNWRGHRRVIVELFWHGVVPLATAAFGRLPGWAMGGGEDLPAGVARQWARWGKHPAHLLGEHPEVRTRARGITAPCLSLSFEDDFYAPRAAVDTLASWYGPRGGARLHVHPRDLGARKIGHFGCFRTIRREDLWVRMIDWLARNAGTVS